MSEEIAKITRLEFGKQHVIIHEVVPLFEIYGIKQFRIAYHITDYDITPPLKTPVAWVFITEPEIKPEERIGKTEAQIKDLYTKKFVNAMREELEKAVKLYRINREVFRA